MAITERSLERAEGRMRARQHGGHAVSARYDRRSARIIVSLNTGVEVTFPPRLATAQSLSQCSGGSEKRLWRGFASAG